MGFWKSLFGGAELSPEEEKKNQEERQFDMYKYDGVKAIRIRQYDYAVKCLRAALDIKDDMETRDYLQQALVSLGDLHGAIEELEVMARNAPDNQRLLLQMARLAYLDEDYVMMTSFCERAEAIDAEVPLVHYLYAQAYLGQSDLVNAIARLTKAIALDDDYADARLLRAQTLMQMGDLDGAREDADWLLEHVGDHEDVLLLDARLKAAKGPVDEAITAYGKVIDVNPFQVDAFRERGKLRFDSGDKQGAEEDMQKVLELNPDEMDGVSGDYSAEGIEQRVKQAYSNMNPFGI